MYSLFLLTDQYTVLTHWEMITAKIRTRQNEITLRQPDRSNIFKKSQLISVIISKKVNVELESHFSVSQKTICKKLRLIIIFMPEY